MNTENKSHLDYPAINVEWVMNKVDDTLCSYLANWQERTSIFRVLCIPGIYL